MCNRPDFKVVLLGDVSVGKTSLLRRYTERRFEDTVSTVGGTFVMREWAGHTVALWDTAGKERFHGLGSMFCRGARAVLLVYDVTSRATFAALEERFLGLTDSADAGCIFALVGNKADLLPPPPPPSLTLQSDGSPGALAPEEERRRLRQVSAEEARDFYGRVLRYRDTVAGSAGAAGARRSPPAVERACFEASAKSGRGVDEAFEGVFEMLAPRRRDWCGTVPLDDVEKCRGRRGAPCACS
ncbi:ras-related protein Rab-20-like [Lethenteron reissneri]|uniref:ras-related protein Rab-20-like n=1 Tax=Lethenteron reissneri TaxID=7753 RepID=UPI002AB64A16|nr:ras-related protein Rab-20-like [Lethenteron reissneri]XP_061431333.1 ras-related protein Rab-20-like [Lethenteron reissneri]